MNAHQYEWKYYRLWTDSLFQVFTDLRKLLSDSRLNRSKARSNPISVLYQSSRYHEVNKKEVSRTLSVGRVQMNSTRSRSDKAPNSVHNGAVRNDDSFHKLCYCRYVSNLIGFRYIDLEGNKITRLSKSAMRALDALPARNQSLRINLSTNPFSCKCGFSEFKEWLSTTKVVVTDKDSLRYVPIYR